MNQDENPRSAIFRLGQDGPQAHSGRSSCTCFLKFRIVDAGTLAEQVIQKIGTSGASITVWHREQTGAVSVFDIPTAPPIYKYCDSYTIYLDKGLEEKLFSMRASSLPNESGGILLGYHDFNIDEIVIIDALPPPQDSSRSEGFFDRGVDGLIGVVDEAKERTANVVTYIGEWHSHPKNHSAMQSSTDLLQLYQLATEMADDGLPVLQLIVGENDLKIYFAEAH